jgi:hypothetical protein
MPTEPRGMVQDSPSQTHQLEGRFWRQKTPMQKRLVLVVGSLAGCPQVEQTSRSYLGCTPPAEPLTVQMRLV